MKTKTNMKKKTRMKKEMKKKRPKITKKMQKHEKNKKETNRVPKDNSKGKGRKNSQNDTEMIQNEKQRKGFEKKLLVAIPKDQDHFEAKEGTMKMPKGEKNRNEKTMKKLTVTEIKGNDHFQAKNDDQNEQK